MEITHKNNSKDGFFIAEENGKRMGYISYEWMNESVFAIMHTVVEPAFQGKGIAKRSSTPPSPTPEKTASASMPFARMW